MTNRKIVAISIEPYFLSKLDAEAKRLGVTRSRLITLLAIEAIPLRDWASPHSKHEPLLTKESLNEAYGYRASIDPKLRYDYAGSELCVMDGAPVYRGEAARDRDTLEELKAWAARNGWEDDTDEGD